MPKKIHKIFYAPDRRTHHIDWVTLCGEVFWPSWRGTTESLGVTCKRCSQILANKQLKRFIDDFNPADGDT